MDCEVAILNQSGDGEVVKQVGERLPHLSVSVLSDALVVEAVHLRDLPTVVVASEKQHAVRPSHLQRHHQGRALHGVVPTIDIVS